MKAEDWVSMTEKEAADALARVYRGSVKRAEFPSLADLKGYAGSAVGASRKWLAENPGHAESIRNAGIGAGVGGLLGLGSAYKRDSEDGEASPSYLGRALTGALAGGAVGGGLTLAHRNRGALEQAWTGKTPQPHTAAEYAARGRARAQATLENPGPIASAAVAAYNTSGALPKSVVLPELALAGADAGNWLRGRDMFSSPTRSVRKNLEAGLADSKIHPEAARNALLRNSEALDSASSQIARTAGKGNLGGWLSGLLLPRGQADPIRVVTSPSPGSAGKVLKAPKLQAHTFTSRHLQDLEEAGRKLRPTTSGASRLGRGAAYLGIPLLAEAAGEWADAQEARRAVGYAESVPQLSWGGQ